MKRVVGARRTCSCSSFFSRRTIPARSVLWTQSIVHPKIAGCSPTASSIGMIVKRLNGSRIQTEECDVYCVDKIFVTLLPQGPKIALKGKLGFRLPLLGVSGPRVSGLA